MARPRLRVFFGPEDSADRVIEKPGRVREEISVPLGDVLPLLVDATNARRSWVRDFSDELVTIPADLYEVINAYGQVRSTA
jgi:hypothetical protein